MASPPQDDFKPDGAAFDDFFESIGKKAEQLTIDDPNAPKATGDAAAQKPEDPEEDQRVVDEIESLCMNCHENVGPSYFCDVVYTNTTAGNDPPVTHSNPLLP